MGDNTVEGNAPNPEHSSGEDDDNTVEGNAPNPEPSSSGNTEDDDQGPLHTWLLDFLTTMFFKPCPIHPEAQKSKANQWCLPCGKKAGPLCKKCVEDNHRGHTLLVVRFGSYKMAIITDELLAAVEGLDLSHIKTNYSINKKNHTFLSTTPTPNQGGPGKQKKKKQKKEQQQESQGSVEFTACPPAKCKENDPLFCNEDDPLFCSMLCKLRSEEHGLRSFGRMLNPGLLVGPPPSDSSTSS